MLSLGIVFWILMIVWLVFGLWTTGLNRAAGGSLLLWFLLFLLGWSTFGFPISG